MDSRSDLLGRSPSEVRAALLRLSREQAAARAPGALAEQWVSDASTRPAPVDLRTTLALDDLALRAAHEYEALLLSPVAPLGSSSVLAPTSQDRTLSTTRTSEVVSDPTNVLALECARRLALDPATVRLATVHQTMRMQPVGSDPGRTKHFRLFAMADAGLGLPEDGFEVAAVVRHLSVFHQVLDAASTSLGWSFPGRAAIVRVSSRRRVMGQRVAAGLDAARPGTEVRTEALDSRYYDGLRVGLGAVAPDGSFCEIADLGLFDWVARLLSNRRLRFVASGFGLQLLPLLFDAGRPPRGVTAGSDAPSAASD